MTKKQTILTEAIQIAKEIREELLPYYSAKTPKQQQYLWKAAGGGTFNNSITAMVMANLKEGKTKQEILEQTKKRLDSTVILRTEKFGVKAKAQEDLMYYRKIQKQLGNI